MAKLHMKPLDYIPLTLVLVGAGNWGLYGFSRLIGKEFDLVSWLANAINMPVLGNLVFVVVGIAGVWGLISLIVAHLR